MGEIRRIDKAKFFLMERFSEGIQMFNSRRRINNE